MRRLLLTVALSVVIAAPAFAQQPLKLSFQDGRVTVDATSVPVRTILTEWGKVGGTKVVGAERITGAPMTVKLVNVTEAQALETILRSVAGYMAAPRNGATTGPSMYDRILVMATSSAPAPRPTPRARHPHNRTRSPAHSVSFRPRQRAEQRAGRDRGAGRESAVTAGVYVPAAAARTTATRNNRPHGPRGRRPAGHDRSRTADHHDQSGAGRSRPQPQMPVGVSQPGMMVPSAATAAADAAAQPVTDPPAGRQLSSPVQLSFPAAQFVHGGYRTLHT